MVTRRFIDRARSIDLDRYNSKLRIEQVFQSLVICGLCRGHDQPQLQINEFLSEEDMFFDWHGA